MKQFTANVGSDAATYLLQRLQSICALLESAQRREFAIRSPQWQDIAGQLGTASTFARTQANTSGDGYEVRADA